MTKLTFRMIQWFDNLIYSLPQERSSDIFCSKVWGHGVEQVGHRAMSCVHWLLPLHSSRFLPTQFLMSEHASFIIFYSQKSTLQVISLVQMTCPIQASQRRPADPLQQKARDYGWMVGCWWVPPWRITTHWRDGLSSSMCLFVSLFCLVLVSKQSMAQESSSWNTWHF